MKRRDNIVSEGPRVRGHSISHIDALSILEVDGVAVAFTPTEYRLVMLLLQQLEKLANTSNDHIDLFVSFVDLLEACRLANRSLLAKHVYNASAKLWMAGLSIARVDGYGYCIVFGVEGDANRFLRQSAFRQPRAAPTEEQQLFALA
jgi:hypothetical protein